MLAAQTRTKIVATLGPAVDPPGVLERVLDAGVDVLRVNLSHASPSKQAARVARARAHLPDVAVLADLGGPKLRLGDLPAPVELGNGALVTLGDGGLPVADPDLAARVRVGDPVYLADGTLRLEATAVRPGAVECRVLAGGTLTSRKGINLPADDSALPCLTDKDRRDLAEIDALAPDFVALSYVRHEDDIAAVRRLCALPVVAKIEKQQALERMDAIVAAADAIMVARGDLGVEIPIERVPAAQKRLIRAALAAGKPVITATQMLVSMVSSPLPTRAEVTDVANAVLDGTDAVMLSEETAAGRDPAGAVAMMERILRETEPLMPSRLDGELPAGARTALARAAARLAIEVGAAALVVPSLTGATATCLASLRPRLPILAVSEHPATVRRLGLVWGVTAAHAQAGRGGGHDGDAGVAIALGEARARLAPGAFVVLLSEDAVRLHAL